MKDSLDIKKFVDAIIRHKNGESVRETMSPEREWFLGIGITLVIVLMGTWSSYSLYKKVTDGAENQSEAAPVSVPYEARLVDEAEAKFSGKANTYNQIKSITTAEPAAELDDIVISTNEQNSLDEVDKIINTEETEATSSEGAPSLIF